MNPGPSLTSFYSQYPNFCTTGNSTIYVTATDPQGIQYVRITYTPNGGPTYGPTSMTAQGGNVWAYTITPSGWNEGFVSITVTAADNDGATSHVSNVNDPGNPAYLYTPAIC